MIYIYTDIAIVYFRFYSVYILVHVLTPLKLSDDKLLYFLTYFVRALTLMAMQQERYPPCKNRIPNLKGAPLGRPVLTRSLKPVKQKPKLFDNLIYFVLFSSTQRLMFV